MEHYWGSSVTSILAKRLEQGNEKTQEFAILSVWTNTCSYYLRKKHQSLCHHSIWAALLSVAEITFSAYMCKIDTGFISSECGGRVRRWLI